MAGRGRVSWEADGAIHGINLLCEPFSLRRMGSDAPLGTVQLDLPDLLSPWEGPEARTPSGFVPRAAEPVPPPPPQGREP